MRIAEINMMHCGSTGKIMFGIADAARKAGNEVWTFSPRYYQSEGKIGFPAIPGHTYFGSVFENMLHLRLAQLTGFPGCFSILGTQQLLRMLDRIRPDVLHLHNLHNWTVNLPMLFHYIKKHKIRVVWTLHDCWTFTGKCPYFEIAKCNKWKSGCGECTQMREYPQGFTDRTQSMWKLKRKWFSDIPEMTIVTPSTWLAELVKQSFMGQYSVEVIHNGIDLNIFHPTPSNFREKNNIKNDQFLLLGVAFGWGPRKGLDVFEKLSKRLQSDKYRIVLVGTNDSIDKELPKEILSIHRTQNQIELAEIYTSADIFINPTREDNYPTVNMESIACGTPVLTFATGGSAEIIDADTGVAIPCDDMNALEQKIAQIYNDRPFEMAKCLERAKQFDMGERFAEYVRLYLKMR